MLCIDNMYHSVELPPFRSRLGIDRPAIHVSAGSTRMDKTAVPCGVFWPDSGELRLVFGSRPTPAMSTTGRSEVLVAWIFSSVPHAASRGPSNRRSASYGVISHNPAPVF